MVRLASPFGTCSDSKAVGEGGGVHEACPSTALGLCPPASAET